MIIYLPFNHEQNYYALDFKFRSGRYLFDSSTRNKEKLYLNLNMPYYLIHNINWKKQRKKLLKSKYAVDKTYNSLQE